MRTVASVTWKEKNLDYEIETGLTRSRHFTNSAWKEKNLDYEIETLPSRRSCPPVVRLKRKEPRLRDWNRERLLVSVNRFAYLKRKEPRLRDWNIKSPKRCVRSPTSLKRKEPRLRDWNNLSVLLGLALYHLKRKEPRLRDWNISRTLPRRRLTYTWKEKNLDYEIETLMCRSLAVGVPRRLEKKRTSITRLKRLTCCMVFSLLGCLKRKEPRLRDWNSRS